MAVIIIILCALVTCRLDISFRFHNYSVIILLVAFTVYEWKICCHVQEGIVIVKHRTNGTGDTVSTVCHGRVAPASGK